MYGFYGLKHHTVEISIEAQRTTGDDERTRKDRATQPLDAGMLSFAKWKSMVFHQTPPHHIFPLFGTLPFNRISAIIVIIVFTELQQNIGKTKEEYFQIHP